MIQIGGTTCGKPYGFYAADNCETTYFTIQFKGVNHLDFGDYADGFTPSETPMLNTEIQGCTIADDLTKPLGDINERMLSTALYYAENDSCPVSVQSNNARGVYKTELMFKVEDRRNSTRLMNNRIMTK